MSGSSRQIGQAANKQSVNSLVSMPSHRRNRSLESRNYGVLIEKGRKLYQAGQMSAAIPVLERGLYYDPSSVELNHMLAMAHLQLKSPARALPFLNRLARQIPVPPKLYLLLAITHHKLNDSAAALRAISQHLAGQIDTQGLFMRAKLRYQAGDFSQAIFDIDTLLQKHSVHGHAYLLKIKSLIGQGKSEQAVKVGVEARAVVQEPEFQQKIAVERCKVLFKSKKYEQALIILQDLERDYMLLETEGSMLKARILQCVGRSQQALMLYNQMLAAHTDPPTYCQALAEMAIHHMRERDFYEAFTLLGRTTMLGVRSRPTDQLLRLAEGVTFLMKKKYVEGLLLVGAVQLSLRHSLAHQELFLNNLSHNALGFGNFSLGNHLEALQQYRLITAEEDTDMLATDYNICLCEGILNAKGGRPHEAVSAFEKAFSTLPRPEPCFYLAVMGKTQAFTGEVAEGETEGLVQVLEMVERGLRAGDNAGLYYFRALVYLVLGMNAEALEDIDRAIEKSQDNVAKYFHARGVVFMLDRNQQQALAEFATALSIDEQHADSILEKAKCELITGDSESAFNTLHQHPRYHHWAPLFYLHQHDYEAVLSQCQDENPSQIASFMRGQFQRGGPAGKLLLAMLYQNYVDVVSLVEEAVSLGVSVGCLQTHDLLLLKSYCHYRLKQYPESLATLAQIQTALKEISMRGDNFSEEDERKMLICRVNEVLVRLKAEQGMEALAVLETLQGQVCEGPIADELSRLRNSVLQKEALQFHLNLEPELLSDHLQPQQHQKLEFRFLIPYPTPKVLEVEQPQFEQLLSEFSLENVQNKPEAPWIRRGQFGVIFTNQIRQFDNLNLTTEENEAVRSKMPSVKGSEMARSRLKQDLELSQSVLDKLDRLSKKKKEQKQA